MRGPISSVAPLGATLVVARLILYTGMGCPLVLANAGTHLPTLSPRHSSFRRKPEGGFTFQVQRFFMKYLSRSSIVQALSRRIIAPLNQPRKPLRGHILQPGLPRQVPSQSSYGVLHSTLLPRRPHVAKEGLHPQLMQHIVPGELRAVVEGHRPTPPRRHFRQHLSQRLPNCLRHLGSHRRRQKQPRSPLLQHQQGLPAIPEQHQIRLPMPRLHPVHGAPRPLRQHTALRYETGRTSPSPASPPTLELRSRQVMPPSPLVRSPHLPVHEPVDALVREHLPTLLQLKPSTHLLRRHPSLQSSKHHLPQLSVTLQPGPPPSPRPRPLVRIHRLVSLSPRPVPTQLPSNRRWRAIHTCSDLPDRLPLSL